jgi:hypothetical protein
MPKYLIEREFPQAWKFSEENLKEMAQQSCEVLIHMKVQVHWIKTYVTNNKLYCIYIAPDEEALLEHASFGGFAANRINAVRQIIDPETAE